MDVVPPVSAAHALPLLASSLIDEAPYAVMKVLALVLCVSVHEFGHAYVADRLGDPLQRQQGRVTLNPAAHVDPIGTLLFPLLMAFGVRVPLAWGKPVEWTGHPRFLTRRYTMRTIRFFVSIAGPAMNFLLALFFSLALFICLKLQFLLGIQAAIALIAMNCGLIFFNLLPIPPLDGRVFLEYLPTPLHFVRDALFKYGSLVFLGLLLIGAGSGGPSPLGLLLSPLFHLVDLWIGLLLRLA
jgi:Zn-dependent protease